MGSEDDEREASGEESFEDDSYSSETDDESFGSGCDSDSYDYFEDSNCALARRQEQNYSILKEEEDIQRLMEDDIAGLSSVLSISKEAAAILLHYYKWDVSKVHDAWFANEERVRQRVGLLESSVANLSIADELTCGICFESYKHDSTDTAGCGHPYCSLCWTGYITTSIKDGPGCLLLKCPEPSCAAAVGQDMVKRHVCDKDMKNYSRYLLRSYIEDNSKNKWCPAPRCEYAIHFSAGSGGYDVSCLCSHTFCWNCNEDAHRPVDCTTAGKWILKNNAESESVNWILVNSKPCPKCKCPIQKNLGCMHMVCRAPCNYEFCWLCLGHWSDHGRSTGGYYACNRYNSAKKEGQYDEAERKKQRAKNSLAKYTHYYERWESNESSRKRAQEVLQQMQDVHFKKLSKFLPEFQLTVITDALLQVIECRRVLKWSYAYGYYLPEHEHAKRDLFEYLQGEAESGLERLHQCVGEELYPFLDADSDSRAQCFNDSSKKIDGLTRATRTYFDNLVGALENGLKDVTAAGRAKGKRWKIKTNGGRSGESSRN